MNIFVSYKYNDDQVKHLIDCWPTKVRDYVDVLIDKLDADTDHIYCGEDTDEDLSDLSDEAIYERLKDKMYNTSITVVLISPGMKLEGRRDKSQWIPWEIYYSLREVTRNGRTSHRNGIIAVVLPDKNGSYEYVIKNWKCCASGCRELYTSNLFNIIKYNMFNKKDDKGRICAHGDTIYNNHPSYIQMVKWCDFFEDIDYYVNLAEYRKDHVDDYDLHINVKAE